MRFEEIMGALREGKKVRRKQWSKSLYLYRISEHTYSCEYDFELKQKIRFVDILNDDWEIFEEPKKKVKYYPVLVKGENGDFYISTSFSSIDEAKLAFNSHTPIRLITEIPELIEERDE